VIGGHRFDPDELRPTDTTGEPATDPELGGALAMARELEAMAATDHAQPAVDFEDRVMAAIATEPAPRVVIRPGSAVRGGRVGAIALAVREAWAVAFTGGRPLAVRAQAFAVVLIVVLTVGLLTTAGAVTVGGLLQGRSTPPPSTAPLPTSAPSQSAPGIASPTPTADVSPVPTDIAGPGDTPEPTETAEPGRTPRPTRTGGNAGPGGGGGGGGSTPKPAETPNATRTDDHGGGGGGGSDHGGGGGSSGPGGSGGPGPG